MSATMEPPARMSTDPDAGTAESPVDSHFYQSAAPGSLGERMAIMARDRIHRDFMTLCAPRPGDSILDVGVSDVVTGAANGLERLYPHPEDITAAGLGEGSAFRREYPRVRYQRIVAGEPLPFAGRAFRFAVSNAVLEHVGSEDAQRRFISELARVAETVLITVPHRFFPVEHHTAIPFAHWADAPFRLACRVMGREEWTRQENLILMSRSRLKALAAAAVPGRRAVIRRTGLNLGPLSSNLMLFLP